MRLAVFSYKVCWPSPASPTGYATDGGFAFQMAALSELFDTTAIVVPVAHAAQAAGEIALHGHNLTIVPLSSPVGSGLRRKVGMAGWCIANAGTLWNAVSQADAIHCPIPADVGTLGMLAAYVLRKPLFVRYCGNWRAQRTAAERFWKWFMEATAGGRNVMLATGGDGRPPSPRNPRIGWIFSTTLSERELAAARPARRLIAEDGFRLITVCRQQWGKGTDVLLESMPAIRAALPGTSLDVVGEGDAVPALRERATALGLDGVCVSMARSTTSG